MLNVAAVNVRSASADFTPGLRPHLPRQTTICGDQTVQVGGSVVRSATCRPRRRNYSRRRRVQLRAGEFSTADPRGQKEYLLVAALFPGCALAPTISSAAPGSVQPVR